MTTLKKHAKFAASNSERWMSCPGSLDLSEQAPKQIESAAASEGTKAHELMELALNASVKNLAKFFKNDDYPKKMIEDVQGFVNYVYANLKPGFELLVEEKIQLDFLHPTEAFGTVDVAILEPFGLLHIIDFKYGFGYVDHNQNTQMLYYALGLAHKNHYDFEQVKTTIYQPRAAAEGSSADRSTYYAVDEIKHWKAIFKTAVERAENADLTTDLNPGDHCKYCPAKIICPAISTQSLKDAKLAFDDPVLPAPKELDKKDLSTILSKAHYLELWIDEVKSFAINELKEGRKVPGWKLEPTRAQKTWVNPQYLELDWPKIFDKKGVSPFESSLKSPTQVEKDLKKAGLKKEVVENFLKDNVALVSSNVKLSQNTNDYAAPALEKPRRH